MGISFTEVAKSEIKDHINITTQGYAGFINNIYNKINAKAEETQFKPIKDIADKLCVLLPSKFFATFTEKSVELLRQSKLSFKNLVSTVKAGEQAEDAAEDFTGEVQTATESNFVLQMHEPTGSYSEFNIDEEDLNQLCNDIAAEITELKVYAKQAEDEILEKMQENTMYVAVLVLNKARSAMTIAMCEAMYATVKKLTDLYMDRVELIRKTQADISPNISLENILALGLYGGFKNMDGCAGDGGYRVGKDGVDTIPIPPSMQGGDEEENPFDMNVDGQCFNREEQFKYFGFNFIDSRAVTTDDDGSVSAMDEFGRWLSSSMQTKKISCQDVLDILPAYSESLMCTAADHFASNDFLETANSKALFGEVVPVDGTRTLSELLEKTRKYCEEIKLDKAAACMTQITSFADGYNCEDVQAYHHACDIMSQTLFSMIGAEVDFDDYIDYKIMKGDIASGE